MAGFLYAVFVSLVTASLLGYLGSAFVRPELYMRLRSYVLYPCFAVSIMSTLVGLGLTYGARIVANAVRDSAGVDALPPIIENALREGSNRAYDLSMNALLLGLALIGVVLLTSALDHFLFNSDDG